MATNENDWKTEDFRAKVVSQIEDAVRQAINSGNSTMLTKKPADFEAHVYYKAKSREEYMNLVARLLVCIKDVQNISRVRPMQNVDQSGMQAGQTPQQFASVQPNQIAPQQPGGTVSQAGAAMAQYSIVNAQIQNRPQIMPSVAGHQVHIGHPSRQVTIQQAMQIQHQKTAHQQQQQQQLYNIAQQQQQAALKAHAQQTYPASVSATQSQPYSPHPQPHPSPQTPSQMPSPRPAAQQHPVSTSATHAGRAIHAPSPVQVSQGRPPPTPKPQPSPVSQNVIAPSPVAHVPSPAPPGSTHAAPSPSPQVAASPAGPPSVPTPSTLGSIQSPASIYNPGSVGPSVTSPAPMNPADEQAYLEKLKQLSVYISPLQKMINKLAKEEHSKSEQYKKLTSLLDILANPTKRVTMATLLKVENLLKKVIHTPPSSASTTTEPQPQVPVYTQTICHPLLDVVNQHKKLPLLAHTLQRTFGPILHAIEGPPICPPLPPSKRIRLQENEKKSPLPHALQGEIARLSSRFSVWPSPSQSTKHSCSLLKCSLSDKKLPAVPPIQISVPRNYPYASPECLTGDYGSTPFLQKIQTKLSTKLLHMPEMYSVTALLDAWETSIRQTCNSEVAALT